MDSVTYKINDILDYATEKEAETVLKILDTCLKKSISDSRNGRPFLQEYFVTCQVKND